MYIVLWATSYTYIHTYIYGHTDVRMCTHVCILIRCVVEDELVLVKAVHTVHASTSNLSWCVCHAKELSAENFDQL